MKIMKETKKLSKEEAKEYLTFNEEFNIKGRNCIDSTKRYNEANNMCSNCMFDNGKCITVIIEEHAKKHNYTPEESYKKWRKILKKIVEKGE